MRYVKFEAAYCSHLQRNVEVSEISGLYQAQRQQYIDACQNSFLCPECRAARLVFVNAAVPYFRAAPKAKHAKGCSLVQETMTRSQAENFARNTKNGRAIAQQIDRAMELLVGAKPQRGREPDAGYPDGRPVAQRPADRPRVSRQLPRKRIDLPFSESDYGTFMIFYGTVNLAWEKSRIDGKMQIALYSRTTQRFLCRIYVTDKVYSHITPEYRHDTSYPCKVAFLGNINTDRNHHNYTTLIRSDYLVIRRD